MYVLRTSLLSPFGRKAFLSAAALGLSDRVELSPASTIDPSDSLRQQNPLGKMPVLLLEDGTALYDSSVIVAFLIEQSGSDRLLPRAGIARYKAMTRVSLADGMSDAAVLIVYEPRFREPAQVSQFWIDHQRGKLLRALAAFEATPPGPDLDLVAISLTCALGFIDRRELVAWRDTHPRLVAWLDRLTAEHPIIPQSVPQ